jgi:enolase
MFAIDSLFALEILDSRGRPTVLTRCRLKSGTEASASVPSGASTGTAEALELRDGDRARYRGLGCRKAVANVNGELNRKLSGQAFESQGALDRAMLELDGTPNKARLGANAILSVSLAFARACAFEKKVPLYKHFNDVLREVDPKAVPAARLPRLTVNLFSGGKHAGGQLSIQDILLVPSAAKSTDESLASIFAVYQYAAEFSLSKYNMRPLKADEGGLAPPFESIESAFKCAIESMLKAGLEPGRDMYLAVDVASSHFYRDGRYFLDGPSLDSAGMISRLKFWTETYPIVSIEDGLAEDDWSNWPSLRNAIGGRALVLGDDFLCTNPARIKKAIEVKAASALLLKVNQIGTLSESAEAARLARSAGWQITVSARSGETEDNWLADLAVGFCGDQIKIGSITQSERLAKYNRLLEIEAETRWPVAKMALGS